MSHYNAKNENVQQHTCSDELDAYTSFESSQIISNNSLNDNSFNLSSMLSVLEYDRLTGQNSTILVIDKSSTLPEILNYMEVNATADPKLTIKKLIDCDSDALVEFTNHQSGMKFLQEHIPKNSDLCMKYYNEVVKGNIVERISMHCFGNFVMKKLIDNITKTFCWNYKMLEPFYSKIGDQSFKLVFNRYGYHVIQRFLEVAPERNGRRILNALRGCEEMLVCDQNGNHIMQDIFKTCCPGTYVEFMKNLFKKPAGVKKVIEDKYGCRVIQKCLEELVKYCSIPETHYNYSYVAVIKRDGFEVLSHLMPQLLGGAYGYVENEFANYIVQYLIQTDFFICQREYLIENCVLQNILWFSQDKYASHVVEQAFVHADPGRLAAMYEEVFDGYEPDAHNRNALCIMLFDQYANYVVQRMLEIAAEVRLNKRCGNPFWFERLAIGINIYAKHLVRYSSGKKILEQLKEHSRNIQSLSRNPMPLFCCQ